MVHVVVGTPVQFLVKHSDTSSGYPGAFQGPSPELISKSLAKLLNYTII